MFLIILIILVLIMFFFGGKIIFGLITLAPTLLVFYIATANGLSDFVGLLLGLLFSILILLLCSYLSPKEKSEYDKSIEWFYKEYQTMSEERKQMSLKANTSTILKLEDELTKGIDFYGKDLFNKKSLELKKHKIYLEILQGYNPFVE